MRQTARGGTCLVCFTSAKYVSQVCLPCGSSPRGPSFTFTWPHAQRLQRTVIPARVEVGVNSYDSGIVNAAGHVEAKFNLASKCENTSNT